MPLIDPHCTRCTLHTDRLQVVQPTLSPGARILAIGEAPGADEDRRGEGFVGQAGRNLDALFAAAGVPREAYARANVCACRPPGNRKPTPEEKRACLPHLAQAIQTLRPRVILAVGLTPSRLFYRPAALTAILEQAARRQYVVEFGVGLPKELITAAVEVGCCVVPSPHSSALALNRNAPDGRSWKGIAQAQVVEAVRLSCCAY